MHVVGRLEEQRRPVMPAEDEEHLQENVVAPVAEDELTGLDAVARRERRAKVRARGGRGIPVEQDVVELLGRQVEARRVRVRPLVRVHFDVGGDRLGAVRPERLEVGTRAREPVAHAHSLPQPRRPRDRVVGPRRSRA